MSESTQPMKAEDQGFNLDALLRDAYCSGYLRGHEDITSNLGFESKLGCDEYMIRFGRRTIERFEELFSRKPSPASSQGPR